jgi:carbonic anhydrase
VPGSPAYEVAVRLPGDLIENLVRVQVQLDVAELKADPLIGGLIAGHGLLVVGGRYDLTSGAVEIIA